MIIRGDVLEDRLGLADEQLKMLEEEVDVVVHCAASVDFREKLDTAGIVDDFFFFFLV